MSNKQETRHTITEGNMAKRIVMVLFSVVEVVLAFRFFFKLTGANPGNVFVKGLYSFTQFFVGIFEGIFSISTTPGAETEAIFEPATLIAIIVVGLIAWAVMKLMSTSSTSQVQRTQVNAVNPEVTSNNPNQPQYNQVKNPDTNPVNSDVTTNNPNQTQNHQVNNPDTNPVNSDGTSKDPDQNQ